MTLCGQKTDHGSGRRQLRVLMVEDSEADAMLMERCLERGGFDTECHRVDTRRAMEEALNRECWQLILADHSMPQFSAPEALDLVKSRSLDVPFIIVSGHIDEETAIAAMKAGAHDYVMKDRLGRLIPAVERELREAEVRRVRNEHETALRRSHEELEMRVQERTADLLSANRRLEGVLEERRRLENELLEIAENERRRIGFDLHDDLGQKLTGACLMVKGIEQRLANEKHLCVEDARRVQQLIEEIIRHTHNLAHQFSSLDVKGEDIAAVLTELAGNVKRMFEIPCKLAIKGAIPKLPGNTTLQLHKIAQEAVSNAIKHGKARHVWISLLREGTQLLLTIKNDGLPFARPLSTSRMGLRIMNYRASTIGASLDVKPQDKSGTIVSCALPLQNGKIRSSSPPVSEPDSDVYMP